ncbi:hypothetical protein [Alcanivorax sp. 24]|uniref:hypothetical protein n=1 Tax=Alcanivorax sp. 24 TaxID=2545266 RepID=UPI001F0E611E|nr:hypothetical protein [Alcanivorax sp. 24]
MMRIETSASTYWIVAGLQWGRQDSVYASLQLTRQGYTALTQLASDTQEMLDSLRIAVADTLERKRRLGQYAVIWQDGKPVQVGEDAPTNLIEEQDDQGRESH